MPNKQASDEQLAQRAATKVCVFGSGSFGTALGTVVARNGFPVKLLTRREDVATAINTKHVNPHHLTNCKLPPLLSATTSAAEALNGVKFIVHCIPVQSTLGFLEPLKELIPANVPLISTSKGIHQDTLELMADLVPRALGRQQPMAFLSGPTFAKELMDSIPSGAVLASEDERTRNDCAELFHSPALRVYTTADVIGVEVGGALKNVYALAAGAIEGMGLGVNTVAFLVTRACVEMNILAVSMGAAPHTMGGLAGIGDLMLTCMGGASRNKAVGARIGRGEGLETILADRKQSLDGIAEGVATTPAAERLAQQRGIQTPIICAVAAVLSGRQGAAEAIMALMVQPRHKDFAALPHTLAVRQDGQACSAPARGWQKVCGSMPVQAWVSLAIAEAVALAALGFCIARSRR